MKQIEQISTSRLILTPFTEKYITLEYVSWLNDPEVVKFSELRHCLHTLETCLNYYQSMQNSSHYFWAILRKENSTSHIGNITVHIDIYNNVADIGILLGDTTSWGKGFGYEAWKTVCDFLLKQPQIRKITAGTLSINLPMLSIMKRTHMREDGRRKNHYVVEGQQVDVVMYCLFNNDFIGIGKDEHD